MSNMIKQSISLVIEMDREYDETNEKNLGDIEGGILDDVEE